MEKRITINTEQIAEFCRRWKITEFALFGSVLRSDFRPDSNIDVLVTSAPDAPTLLDLAVMEEELQRLFDHPFDLVTKPSIEQSYNYIHRKSILDSAEVIYAA